MFFATGFILVSSIVLRGLPLDAMEWMQWYNMICLDMGHDPGEDRKAAMVLVELLGPARQMIGLQALRQKLVGRDIVVVGPALQEGWKEVLDGIDGAVISADSSLQTLLENEVEVDVVVTDMDGCRDVICGAMEAGTVAVVHAHGDNIHVLAKNIPDLGNPVVGTCQVLPPPPLVNFGGYTDGDRAVLMALSMTSRSINTLGFDFLNPVEKQGQVDEGWRERKIKKLSWAKKIIESEIARGAPIFMLDNVDEDEENK